MLSGAVEQTVGCRGNTDLGLWVPGSGVKPWQRSGRLRNWLRTQPRGRETSGAERQRPERQEENTGN